jgi:hypothetical protein
VGQAEGRLPNPNIIKSMMTLGTVGYVDPNSVMHGISEHTYKGMKAYMQRSNVTGTQMSDCTALDPVMYGGTVALMADDRAGYLTSDKLLLFSSKQRHVFIVRPPPNTKVNTITPLKFGDKLSLANSLQSSTVQCGYYGCKVGEIDDNTWEYIFRPGNTSGGTMLQLVPTTNAFVAGDNVAYNTPFYITSVRPRGNNSLFQQIKMIPGDTIPSSDDRYYLTFRTDGFVVLYKSPNTEIWKSTESSATPKLLRISATGNLQAQDTQGTTYWTTESEEGVAPFALAVQTDGTIAMYDGTLKKIWSEGTSDKTVQNMDQTLYANINSDLQMVFTDEPSEQSIFSFENTDPTKASKPESCDTTQMLASCKEGCIGFIHDSTANEWQPLRSGSVSTEYKIGTKPQDIYMKVPYVSLKDKSCKRETATFIDGQNFAKYQMGGNLTSSGTKQCGPNDLEFDEKEEAYNLKNNMQWEDARLSAFLYDNSPLKGLYKGTKKTMAKCGNKMEELHHELQKLKNNPNNETSKQQKADSEIVEKQYKSRAVLWSIIAFLVAGFIAVAWYGGVKTLLVTAAVGAVLYLGFRFYH